MFSFTYFRLLIVCLRLCIIVSVFFRSSFLCFITFLLINTLNSFTLKKVMYCGSNYGRDTLYTTFR